MVLLSGWKDQYEYNLLVVHLEAEWIVTFIRDPKVVLFWDEKSRVQTYVNQIGLGYHLLVAFTVAFRSVNVEHRSKWNLKNLPTKLLWSSYALLGNVLNSCFVRTLVKCKYVTTVTATKMIIRVNLRKLGHVIKKILLAHLSSQLRLLIYLKCPSSIDLGSMLTIITVIKNIQILRFYRNDGIQFVKRWIK